MEYLEKLLSSWFSQSSVIPGSTRRVLRRMWPRRGLAVPRSSSVPSLELLCRQETSLFLSHPNAVFAFPISALFNNLWSGYHGEEEPEARGAKSPEGAGSPRRQGSEESHRQEACCQGEKLLNLRNSIKLMHPCFSLAKNVYSHHPGQGCAEGTEGNKERPEGRPRQGWWQEMNILPSNSCDGNFSINDCLARLHFLLAFVEGGGALGSRNEEQWEGKMAWHK